MDIFRLTPIDPTNENWAASSFNGEAIVRAKYESSARSLLMERYNLSSAELKAAKLDCPWKYGDMAKCAVIEPSSDYPAAGPEAILSPAE